MLKETFGVLFCALALYGADAEIAKCEWSGNNLGKVALTADYVDPDFKPLKLFGNTVMSGFKKITLDRFGLPEAIQYQDTNILQGATRIELVENGRKLKFTPDQFRLELSGKNGVRGKASFNAGDVRVDICSVFDFDLTVRYTVTLTPLKDKVSLDEFALVFPMNLPGEKLLLYQTEPPAQQESGLDAQKRRVHLTIKPENKKLIAPGFCALFWTGNTRYGLSWNFESAKNWFTPRGQELVFDPASGDMTINFIQKTTMLDKPVTYELFLTPTPFREMPKNWRAWNYNWRGSTTQKPDRTLFNQLIYWSSVWRAGASGGFNAQWFRNPDEIKKNANADKGMNKANYYIPQLICTRMTWEDDDGNVYVMEDPYLQILAEKYHRTPGQKPIRLEVPEDAIRFKNLEECNKTIGKLIAEKKKLVMKAENWDAVFSPELADHMVYGLNQFVKLGVGGIYYDGINPNANYSSWAAWTDEEGKLRPFFHYAWQRDLLKRMREVVKRNDPNEVIIAHQSGTRPVSTLSLCDAIIPGETFYYWYHDPEKRDASPDGAFYYAHIVGDIDNLKGEFFYRQWGIPHILLPEVRGRDGVIFKNPKGTRTMLAYTLHFDMLYFPTMCQVNEIYNIYKIRNRFGMADTAQELVEFVPYWENKAFSTSNENVKISYYDKVKQQELYTSFDIRKKYMMIVSNLQFGNCDFEVMLPKGLQKARVLEMQSNQEVTVAADRFRYSLPPYEFAIFEVTGELDDNRGTW